VRRRGWEGDYLIKSLVEKRERERRNMRKLEDDKVIERRRDQEIEKVIERRRDRENEWEPKR